MLVPILCIVLVALILYYPPVQRRAVGIAENILREKTGFEVSVGRVGISPIADIDLHSVSLLDNSADTLIAVDDFILRPDLHAIRDGVAGIRRFRIRNLSADTKDLLPGIGLRGKVGRLDIVSDSTSFYSTYTLVNEVSLAGVDLTVNLPAQQEDTPPDNDSSSFGWVFDVRKASIRDAKVRLNPIDLDVDVSDISFSGTVDIGRTAYLCLRPYECWNFRQAFQPRRSGASCRYGFDIHSSGENPRQERGGDGGCGSDTGFGRYTVYCLFRQSGYGVDIPVGHHTV